MKVFITEEGTELIEWREITVSDEFNISHLIEDYPKVKDYISLLVHDSIYLVVPEGEADLWYTRLEVVMRKELTDALVNTLNARV